VETATIEANTSASCRGLAEQLRLMTQRASESGIASTCIDLRRLTLARHNPEQEDATYVKTSATLLTGS
jgi:hypothetical protein